MFARDHAAEVSRDLHDAGYGGIGLLQHQVVVGVDRDVRVYVAIARMHVQCDPDATLEHALVDALQVVADRSEGIAREDRRERLTQFLFP